MKRLALLVLGISTLTWATGCCCLWPNYCSSYYGGYGCPDGSCGVGGPTVLPQGAYYNGPSAAQAASLNTAPTTAAAPVTYGPGYPQTAMVPLESLPTY